MALGLGLGFGLGLGLGLGFALRCAPRVVASAKWRAISRRDRNFLPLGS